MASIDITTTQNVTISYELARLRERALAWLIDSILLGFAAFLLLFLLYVASFTIVGFVLILLIIPFSLCYTLMCEFFANGKTPGKYFMKLKVIRIDGRQPVFFDYLLRWVFRFSDIWLSAGTLAVVFIGSSERSQRMGDLLSNTVVVRSRSSRATSLKDILNIRTLQDYQPRYPLVKAIREEDMLVLKQVLERYSRFPNRAHKEVVALAAERVAFLMGLPSVPEYKVDFLKECIRDYIVLTR